MQLAAGTIAAKCDLAMARVLAESFTAFHPGTPFFVLLADEEGPDVPSTAEPFIPINLSQLPVGQDVHFRFIHNRQELTYACTPFLLSHLLERGFDAAVFLKQETLVAGDLSRALDRLSDNSVILIPHLAQEPSREVGFARELDILQAGVYNVGFLGVRSTPSAHQLLSWWGARTSEDCRHAPGEGLHFEQRWLDLAPALFEGTYVYRDPTFCIGHWNLAENTLRLDDGRIAVNGAPAGLVRFSGFDPDRPDIVTRYHQRISMEELGPASEVFRLYARLLDSAGHRHMRLLPYGYATFDNGVPIPDIARRTYRRIGRSATFPKPFATGRRSFYSWLRRPANRSLRTTKRISNLWYSVWQERVDLQHAFPEPLGSDRDRFRSWVIATGSRETPVPGSFSI